jgi:hypothetical protein
MSTFSNDQRFTFGDMKHKIKFTLFPKLPPEIRINIWKFTVIPRLVHWRLGGGRPPATFRVNRESREITLPYYRVCFNKYLRNQGYYTFWMNPVDDIVYRKQQLPNLIRMNDLPINPLLPATIKGPEWNIPHWIRQVKHLGVNLDEACATPLPVNPVKRLQDIWTKLQVMCPDLEELIDMLYKNLEKADTMGALVEVQQGNAEQNEMMREVRNKLNLHRIKGEFLGLRLTFMKKREKKS